MTALKAGVAPESVRRPLARTSVEEFGHDWDGGAASWS